MQPGHAETSRTSAPRLSGLRRNEQPRQNVRGKSKSSGKSIPGLLCRSGGPGALRIARTLTGVCGSKAAPAAARVSAAQALLDRGWGKAPQPHTGEDDKDIRVTVRNIVEERRKD